MGWREFQAWLRQRVRDAEDEAGGTQDDPGSWDDAKSRDNFSTLDEQRRKLRGR